MDNHHAKVTTGNAAFYVTTALMYVTLTLLALSPIAVIWFAADWLNEVFRQSDTFFSHNPRLYTVLTIIAISAAITLLADIVYHHVKAQQKRQLEHI